eukprot:CAMPEP_0206519244 /NCGR_PEP_ID=MMETSP0324_2-20121206/65067_1 /ASSEMBLY_ACC=CAM_ASM_000836 /TAXON_ID=2866 /ORGANISM="Crypthecodinium cohnii, Strain Seligo" /LENGTH=49 /DNA_ID= /DNA_START= /DNA_END= /DNA_ORIENTATION=
MSCAFVFRKPMNAVTAAQGAGRWEQGQGGSIVRSSAAPAPAEELPRVSA